MSDTSLDISVLPSFHLPTTAIYRAGVCTLQSIGVATTLWLLLAAPGFLS